MQSPPNIARMKRRHNRIKRRIALGAAKPGDEQRLMELKRRLGYVRS